MPEPNPTPPPNEQAAFARFSQFYDDDSPPPWDSGIVPPEVVALVEGDKRLRPGLALDIGCGTGTSSIYLAQHGWTVLGIDWIAAAVETARQKALAAGLSTSQVRFQQASVIAPDFLAEHDPVDLWLDVGCFHIFAEPGRASYADHAARLVRPGGTLRLYGWCEHENEGRTLPLNDGVMRAVFGPAFVLIDSVRGPEKVNNRAAAWYTLRRTAPTA